MLTKTKTQTREELEEARKELEEVRSSAGRELTEAHSLESWLREEIEALQLPESDKSVAGDPRGRDRGRVDGHVSGDELRSGSLPDAGGGVEIPG